MRSFENLELTGPLKEQFVSATVMKYNGNPTMVALGDHQPSPVFIGYDRYQKSVEAGRLLSLAEYELIRDAEPTIPGELPPNWTHIKSSFYLVRTQAGFRQALKHFQGENGDDAECRNYPKTYPAVVSFSWGYNGSIYTLANIVHVNEMRAALHGA